MTTSREDTKSLVICDDAGYTKIGHSKTRQHVAAILANLATLCIGMANAWTAPALPLIQRQTDVILPLYATEEQASWISSLLPIGAVVGALPAGYLADKLGRRRVLLMMALPFFLGWMLIVLAADSVVQVFLGRFVIGVAAGACTVLVPLYNEEIAEDSIRGILGVYFDFIGCLGILFMYVLGACLSYMWFTLVCTGVPLVFFATFFWMPETPTFLLSKHLFLEAEKSLLWLRNGSIVYHGRTQPEIMRLLSRLQETTRTDRPSLLNKTTFKTVAIVLGLMFFHQMDGMNAVVFYAVQIFQDAGSSISPSCCSIIIGTALTLAILVPTFTVDRIGRKPLLLMSSIAASICMAVLAGYFYYKDNDFDVDSWRWVPLASLVTYVSFLSMGFGPLPFFMVAELVPTAAKGRVTAYAIAFNRSITFMLTKMFPFFVHDIGAYITYGFFSGMCMLAAIFVAIWVPETKGKSREEIQLLLRN
ncbi:facilitated trehalose transporter Tret1 isoform X3 [Anabrus simplex]|uniref:facilitated trehalose transporter Tret1 isoform X3 n=1 Tax=Anabrus simplex TaxID=316456 RepID=UPI0035A34863